MRVAAAAVAALLLASCTTDPTTGQQTVNRTAIGAGLGAVAGAGVGYLTGDDGNDRRNNALIGAGIGALAGGLAGNYMDRQEAEYERALAAIPQGDVNRLGDTIVINVPSNVSFVTNSAQITPQFYATLDQIAATLNQYPQSYVDITGHTDSTGQLAYNQQLSQQRAEAVANYLVSKGVLPARIVARGVGPSQPIASNDTQAGRDQNRRVEIQIRPFTA